jgi:hypothetical protein
MRVYRAGHVDHSLGKEVLQRVLQVVGALYAEPWDLEWTAGAFGCGQQLVRRQRHLVQVL